MYGLLKAKPQLFSVILLIPIFAGCSPSYKTAYLYSLPMDEKQAVCFSICEEHRGHCVQLAKSEKRNCELRNQIATIAYRQCLSVNKSGYGGAIGPACDDTQDFCFSDIERCNANYRGCFIDCGGEISEQMICTSNCPD